MLRLPTILMVVFCLLSGCDKPVPHKQQASSAVKENSTAPKRTDAFAKLGLDYEKRLNDYLEWKKSHQDAASNNSLRDDYYQRKWSLVRSIPASARVKSDLDEMERRLLHRNSFGADEYSFYQAIADSYQNADQVDSLVTWYALNLCYSKMAPKTTGNGIYNWIELELGRLLFNAMGAKREEMINVLYNKNPQKIKEPINRKELFEEFDELYKKLSDSAEILLGKHVQ